MGDAPSQPLQSSPPAMAAQSTSSMTVQPAPPPPQAPSTATTVALTHTTTTSDVTTAVRAPPTGNIRPQPTGAPMFREQPFNPNQQQGALFPVHTIVVSALSSS